MAEEATVNPDGSTTFGSEGAAGEDVPPNMGGEDFEEAAEEIAKGIDPAFYLIFAVIIVGGLFLYNLLKKRKDNANMDDFFSNLDGDKFNIKLPSAVDEYYEVKAKCESDGWEPGQPMANGQPTNHHRLLAQALMKRCIADIPIVTHIQKESQGMNKLYSQSMCSVKQWKSYQAAEAMVSAEVEEVRAEADEIEPGWSQAVWRQAMQYHNMIKQKEEQAKSQAAAQAKAKEEKSKEQARYEAVKKAVEEEKARRAATAAELVKAEEREKDSKKSFKGGSIKKGFLDNQK
mmetsp:Transcript_461/g.1029  ORF Transcript_461/g.1029 Transcript_461/m.1029 type:complete len:289 (+) Transcript_461:142-1008(+)